MVNGVYVKEKSEKMEDRDYRNETYQLEKVVQSLQSEISELKKMVTWVPVENELPPAMKDVLVRCTHYPDVMGNYTPLHGWRILTEDGWKSPYFKSAGQVTHWLLIPQINNK